MVNHNEVIFLTCCVDPELIGRSCDWETEQESKYKEQRPFVKSADAGEVGTGFKEITH
jgi:hypothetical protein